MGDVIELRKYRVRKHKEKLIKCKNKKDEDLSLSDRCEKIKASFNRVNELLKELKR